MVNKQRLGNPQLRIRVDREILVAAEKKLGGRAGVGRRIKALLAGEIDEAGAGGDAHLKALLAEVSDSKKSISEIVMVLRVMTIQRDKLDERLNNLDERLKKIESNHALTLRAIQLLAERLGAAEARSSAPSSGKKG
jgi:hypothetical protein